MFSAKIPCRRRTPGCDAGPLRLRMHGDHQRHACADRAWTALVMKVYEDLLELVAPVKKGVGEVPFAR